MEVTYGKLTVLGSDLDRKYYLRVRCECGTEKSVAKGSLVSGATKSCGCATNNKGRTTHGMFGTPTYQTWTSMLQRIRNFNSIDYPEYGGRGISVDPAWEKFENFYADMGERPEGKTLERLNTDGDYCKANCVWATRKEQNSNKRNSVRYRLENQMLSINQLMEISGLAYHQLYRRLRSGMAAEDAIKAPPHARLPKTGNQKEKLYDTQIHCSAALL